MLCYAAARGDCSGKPTREHPISDCVLEQIGDFIVVEGVWPEAKRLPVSGMVARILCGKHNSELSPLDTVAGAFFRACSPASDRIESITLSGHLLERWALKALVGLATSGNLPGATREKGLSVPDTWLGYLFGDIPLPQGAGFYHLIDPIPAYRDSALAIEALRYPSHDREAGSLYGITTKFRNVHFAVTATLTHAHFPNSASTYRPSRVVSDTGTAISLQWP